ncbi:hypothetical protein ElyMa_001126700 [Elysia marginata]|uniref:Uncharacterized protein n=1 Tax=Elysia marginata TaxID=1093978 RepID=A0AAV4HWF1_9GAST|nr:hypothetical protein ElyMa_001126700 [Elysia marginata]
MRDLLEPIGESKAHIRGNRRYYDSTWGETGMYSFSFTVQSVQRICCKRQNPKRAAYSSTVSTSTTSDMPMTLQAMLDHIVDKYKEYGMEINAKRPRRCTLAGTQRRLQ